LRQFRMFAAVAVVGVLLAACGSKPNGPNTAEQSAMSAISGAQQVVSYPIPLGSGFAVLPAADRSVGKPAYAFTVQIKGQKEAAWVVAGPQGAKLLTVYPSIGAAAGDAARLGVGQGTIALVAQGPLGRLKLPVIGASLSSVQGSQLRRLGLKLPAASYEVLSLLTLPAHANAAHLGVAHVVLGQGKVLGEYSGTD